MSTPSPTTPKASDDHYPFILRTIAWADPTDKTAERPKWDMSHMHNRSYDLEYVGRLHPSHPSDPSDQPPPPPPSKNESRKIKIKPFYTPHYLPELTSAQVNALFAGILKDYKHWNAMTGFLTQKFTEGIMEECELQEWKDICRSVKKMGSLSIVDKEAYKRMFCNNFLLWFVAVDIRYKYDVSDEFAKMVGVPQVTLIFQGALIFALYQCQYVEVEELVEKQVEKKMKEKVEEDESDKGSDKGSEEESDKRSDKESDNDSDKQSDKERIKTEH